MTTDKIPELELAVAATLANIRKHERTYTICLGNAKPLMEEMKRNAKRRKPHLFFKYSDEKHDKFQGLMDELRKLQLTEVEFSEYHTIEHMKKQRAITLIQAYQIAYSHIHRDVTSRMLDYLLKILGAHIPTRTELDVQKLETIFRR